MGVLQAGVAGRVLCLNTFLAIECNSSRYEVFKIMMCVNVFFHVQKFKRIGRGLNGPGGGFAGVNNASNFFKEDSLMHFEMLIVGGSVTGHLLELRGEMGYAAIVHLKGDLCEAELVVNE
jgi:hypothetical protein